LFTPRGGLLLQPSDGNPERIILADDASIGPTLPVVDTTATFAGATMGVLDYTFGNFKLFVTALPAAAGTLTRETATAAGPNELAVATFDAEGLDPTDPPSKFAALANLIVSRMGSPDLISVEEVEDDNGPTNDATVGATTTWATLIAAIQAAGGPAYDFRQVDPADDQDGGQPGANIRQGFLFRSDRGLAFVDAAGGGSTTANNVLPGPHLEYSPGRLDPTSPAFTTSRKPLAGEFRFQGAPLFVVGNHFNSKGGDDPLFGRYQPPARPSDAQRHQQAQVVNDFVDAIVAQDANANVVVLGDINDFEYSGPLATLQGSPAVLTNLHSKLTLAERYSFVLDGNSQALDHILTSSHLTGRAQRFDSVHVNAEFGTGVAGHDPVIGYLCANAAAFEAGSAQCAPPPPVDPGPGTTAPPQDGGGAPVSPPAGGTVRDTLAPAVTLLVGPKQRRARVIAKGLSITVGCSEPCTFTAKVLLGGRGVGSATGRLTAAGKKKIALKLTRKGKAGVRRMRSAKLVVRVTASDAAGNARTVTRKVTLRR
jgi:hypothetical protein